MTKETIDQLGQAFETKKDGADGWYGKEMTVQSQPIIDPATGEILTIRLFEFKKNPAWRGQFPSKQDIFNMHWRQIKQILWGDGLVAIQEEEFAPRIEFKNDRYLIFLTCKPRLGTFFTDKAKPLQNYLRT